MKVLQRAAGLSPVISAVLLALAPTSTLAGPTNDEGAVDAGAVDGGRQTAPPEDRGLEALRQTTAQIRVLLEGSLDGHVSVDALFDVPLDEEDAVQVAITRLEALALGLQPPAAKARAARPATLAFPDAGTAAAALFEARRELDAARLSFYRLPAEQRRGLLTEHAQRRSANARVLQAAREADAASEEQVARGAERARALRSTEDARSEAQRLVAAEYLRLLDVEREQVVLGTQLRDEAAQLIVFQEATLGWQRKAREARAKHGAGAAEEADILYDELRFALKQARAELATTLDTINQEVVVPQSGPDPLADLDDAVDHSVARTLRATINATSHRLVAQKQALGEEKAAKLLDKIGVLNRERLGLLDSLTSAKQSAITGFTPTAFEQASSEFIHLALILRYHRHATGQWLGSLRSPGQSIGVTVGRTLVVLLQWSLVIGLFVVWRRRGSGVLIGIQRRVRADDRLARLAQPSRLDRALGFFIQIRKPLEWLIVTGLLIAFLPDTVTHLLEVELLAIISIWTLTGALVVDALNASFTRSRGLAAALPEVAQLRLRSLRLIGRVVVALGLVLVISARLVGEGTIYEWVLSICWVATIPVLLVLIRWWRPTVFARTALVRKKSAFQKWILANTAGWKSFIAAALGAGQLFAQQVVKATASWVGRFDTTRRLLAYLFRRELDKLSADDVRQPLAAIAPATIEALSPGTPSTFHVKTDTDERLEPLRARIRDHKGGLYAIVGEKGLGKSTGLRRLAAAAPGCGTISTPKDPEQLRAAIAGAAGLEAIASIEELARQLNAPDGPSAVFFDDFHRLVQPVMGGLAHFDQLIALARAHSSRCTWVFTLDQVIWDFLARARGIRPMFDDVVMLTPLHEAEIVALITQRSQQAGVNPSFERLLERLPVTADEIDKREAVEDRAAGFYRLLWDYSAGNPGVALHIWSTTLCADAEGTAFVRVFQGRDSSDLEQLPDSAVFVLRAVLQLAPAAPDEIVRATMLKPSDVADALRYAERRGYIEPIGAGFRVSWPWFRALTRFLQRRHLLVATR